MASCAVRGVRGKNKFEPAVVESSLAPESHIRVLPVFKVHSYSRVAIILNGTYPEIPTDIPDSGWWTWGRNSQLELVGNLEQVLHSPFGGEFSLEVIQLYYYTGSCYSLLRSSIYYLGST